MRRECGTFLGHDDGRDAILKAWQDGVASAPAGPATGVVSTWNHPATIVGAIAGLRAVGTILV